MSNGCLASPPAIAEKEWMRQVRDLAELLGWRLRTAPKCDWSAYHVSYFSEPQRPSDIYMNEDGQAVNPYTGHTVGKNDAWWHGSLNTLKSWLDLDF